MRYLAAVYRPKLVLAAFAVLATAGAVICLFLWQRLRGT